MCATSKLAPTANLSICFGLKQLPPRPLFFTILNQRLVRRTGRQAPFRLGLVGRAGWLALFRYELEGAAAAVGFNACIDTREQQG